MKTRIILSLIALSFSFVGCYTSFAAREYEEESFGQIEETAPADTMLVFEDENGKMNRSLLETGGEMMVVSQFTLLADCRKGRRPSFVNAAEPEAATELYEYFVSRTRNLGITVATGRFRAMMEVALINEGPVTIIIESRT